MGTTHLSGLDVTAAPTIAGSAVKHSRHVRFNAPIAAELISIKAAAAVANGAVTIAAQPDYPRKLQVRIVDADSSITAGTLTLVGIGPSGEAVTEVVTLTGGTATKVTTFAYAHLTSGTVAALAGATGADTLGIGVATALGLPGMANPASSTFAVHKSNVGNADEAVGTVDATAGTIAPTSAPDGAKNFDFWYTFQA